jgi:hypothetical protein
MIYRKDNTAVTNGTKQIIHYHPAYCKSSGQSMSATRDIPGLVCANKINPTDNKSNQLNRNKGTYGTNRHYDQAHGNRGKQMNPNQQGLSSERIKR